MTEDFEFIRLWTMTVRVKSKTQIGLKDRIVWGPGVCVDLYHRFIIRYVRSDFWVFSLGFFCCGQNSVVVICRVDPLLLSELRLKVLSVKFSQQNQSAEQTN